MKGYTFILAHHPRHTKKTAYGQRIPGIAEALAQCAPKDGRPFFFSQHRIIKDTAGGPWAGGQEGGESREALNGYSNAVAFCGHGHVEAQDERSIWQREFTAVEVPSLRYVSIRAGRENSRGKDDSPSKMMGMVNTNDGKQGLLMDVYDDRIVLFRRDFVNDCEIAAPWEIPLPFGRGEKPYDPELRRRREVAPQFEEGAKVTVRRRMAKDRAGFEHKDAYDVSFPSVRSSPAHPRAFDYEVTAEAVEADVVRVLKQKRVFSYYGHCPEHLDSHPVACVFSREELSSKAKRIRFRVRPCGCFGAKGREIVSPFEARLDNKP